MNQNLCCFARCLWLEHRVGPDFKPDVGEFRGAWIATVLNLDWPSSRIMDGESKKLEVTSMLDELKIAGINAVMFQVPQKKRPGSSRDVFFSKSPFSGNPLNDPLAV